MKILWTSAKKINLLPVCKNNHSVANKRHIHIQRTKYFLELAMF